MRQPTSRLVLAAAVFAAGVIGIACSGSFKSSIPTPTAGPLGQPEFNLTSKEFAKEFKDNRDTAHAKYKNKVIELTGKVLSGSYNEEGKPRLDLEGPDAGNYPWASCLMTSRFPWSKANPGQTITLKGRANPTFAIPQLVNCEIVKVTGGPVPRLTADEFARRTADAELFKKKDRQKTFVVSGEIETIAPGPNRTGLYLKTQAGNQKCLIHFTPEDFKRLNVASWKPGQQLKVLGGDSSNPNAVGWLVNCVPMEDPK